MSRVIALGEPTAGDDGVGPAVLHAMADRALPADTELQHARDATALMRLLETPARVVVIDAALGETAGELVVLHADALPGFALQPVSSHAMSVSVAIALARQLAPDRVSPSISIVAVTVLRAQRWREGLSPEVAAAVPRAVELVLELLQGADHA